MTTPAFEAFLARIYVDGAARARFLMAPREAARTAGLCDSDVEALVAIDRDGLRLFAASLVRRRRSRDPGRVPEERDESQEGGRPPSAGPPPRA